MIVFTKVAETTLYLPEKSAPDEAFVFYLVEWSNEGRQDPPQTLSADDAWSGHALGYFVFLDRLPEPESLPVLFGALQSELPSAAPSHTGIVWSTWADGALGVLSVLTLDGQQTPPGVFVKDRFISPVTPGIHSIGLAAQTPVATLPDEEGHLEGLIFQYPPQPAEGGRPKSDPPWGGGVLLPLSGPLSGCLTLTALLNDPSQQQDQDSARKQVFKVSTDPVRPYDPNRTWLIPTGVIVGLSRQADGSFQLQPELLATRESA